MSDISATDQLAINTIRFLAVDMVEKADSGHPGTPMALAPLAYRIWTRHLRHSPDDPTWPNRDRFVLSCGHASALLYSLLHLAGYGLPIEELERFRQLGSKTPGHPEYGHTVGIETTTGPLGQGISSSVGIAIAEQLSANEFNREGFPVVDFRTWVLASDGDMMEGVSSEASSLAGHLGLGKLVVFYDDNRISIDGPTSLAFSEDVVARYAAYGWHVQRISDVNDLAAIDAAIEAALQVDDRPSFIAVRTEIGFGAPHKAGTAEAHGAPLGAEETQGAKRNLGWPEDAKFLVPDEARAPFEAARERGRALAAEWRSLFGNFAAAHPEVARDFDARLAGELPAGWEEALPAFDPADKPVATRSASGKVLAAIAPKLPQLVGGSADLTPSNNTQVKGRGDFEANDRSGRYFRFGVREHAMGAILNGITLSKQWIPYGGTFLIFSEYMRPPIRLASLMGIGPVFVYTHDSIFLGEDGPTHQPIEQLASLRSIPGITVLRPADASETAEAWRFAIKHRTGPTVIALTRQPLPILAETSARAKEGLPRGGYVLAESEGGAPEAILIATGSEVWLCIDAQKKLVEEGIRTRVVSLPSWELFAAQSKEYRDEVLPPAIGKRLAVEAASPFGWHRWVGDEGDILGIERFGASAPYKDLAPAFGFTPD
ncbi:MAG TPA: transketolase, partial [Thermoanaerobaculia bacterium]|nr:transketolase [Thermoanaerobaculia bacterium]